MTKGYWVAMVDVHDPDADREYIAANAHALNKYEGRFIVRGGEGERPEGCMRSRILLIEFLSYRAALDCYYSPEYAGAECHRLGKSHMDLAIVEGYSGPQPSNR